MGGNPMISIDFHTHTSFSGDSLLSPKRLLASARTLSRIVICDHNTIMGARDAHQLDPARVISGEEIMTACGELLAAYVTEAVPPGLSPQETIRLLRVQGAFISVAHPFDTPRKGHWELADLLEIVPLVDAIEVFNARCMKPGANRLAADFACEHHLPGIAGSDAHTGFEVGRARMMLPEFEGPEGLREVIGQGRVEGRSSPSWVHLASRYASLVKKVRK